MSAEITRYVLVDREDRESDHEWESMDDAIREAGNDHAVIERHYTFSDSELVWTPNGKNTWPPKSRARGGQS